MTPLLLATSLSEVTPTRSCHGSEPDLPVFHASTSRSLPSAQESPVVGMQSLTVGFATRRGQNGKLRNACGTARLSVKAVR